MEKFFKKRKLKRNVICFIISLALVMLVLYLGEGITGDKEFSDYTSEEWSAATPVLVALSVASAAALFFGALLLITFFKLCLAVVHYFRKKYSGISDDCCWLWFNDDAYTRTCGSPVGEVEVLIVVEEFDMESRAWQTVEKGRVVDRFESVENILMTDYGYRLVFFFPR